jgi:GNAT superfamily N-acetyltransferase
MYNIRDLLKSEIKSLKGLPPEDWDLNLPELVSFHFGYPYFFPVVAESGNKIIGCGNGFLNGSTGWLGNIIVSPENRKKGIGYELTAHLVEIFKNKGCTSQLLIASEMGKNIYSKIGFKATSSYQFYRQGKESKIFKQNISLKKIKKQDYPLLKKFDMEITGEERFHLIQRFFSTGLIYRGEQLNEILGLYLPDFGSGLVLANDPEVGLELMKYRISQGKTKAVVPSENSVATDFLLKEGYQLTLTLPRMALGNEVSWKPGAVFNRAAGYCG